MSKLKRSDITRAIKSLEKCVSLCKSLPSDQHGFARVKPIITHLQQAVGDLTNADDDYDSHDRNYYLNGCNDEIGEIFLLLKYLIGHCEGEVREKVLDIHNRLIKIRAVIYEHFWSSV